MIYLIKCIGLKLAPIITRPFFTQNILGWYVNYKPQTQIILELDWQAYVNPKIAQQKFNDTFYFILRQTEKHYNREDLCHYESMTPEIQEKGEQMKSLMIYTCMCYLTCMLYVYCRG